MHTWVKIIGGIVAAIVILAIVVIITLINFINPNQYKHNIAEMISLHTNKQPVTISGDMAWKIFPRPGIQVKGIIINNPSGFSQPTFLNINTANMTFKLLPLLKHKFELASITLNQMTLNLEINKDGHKNWNPEPTQPVEVNSSPEADKTKSEERAPVRLGINALAITASQVNWFDQRNNQQAALTQFNFKSTHTDIAHAFPINLTCTLQAKKLPAAGLPISVQGMFMINPEQKHYHITNFVLQTQYVPLNHAEPIISKFFAQDINYNGIVNQLKVLNFRLHNKGMTSYGSLVVNDFTDHPLTEGYVQVRMQPRLLLQSLGYSIADNNISGKEFLNAFTANARIQSSVGQIIFNNVRAKLDQSTLLGNVQIKTGDDPQVSFDMQLNHINLDHYMDLKITCPSKKYLQLARTSLLTTTAAAATMTSIRSETLNGKAFNITGNLFAKHLTAHKVSLTQLNAHINARDKLITIEPFSANTNGGTMNGRLLIDRSESAPKFTLGAHFNNVDLQRVSKTVWIKGKSDIVANINMAGTQKQQQLQTLNGKVQLTAHDGLINGINLPSAIANVMHFLKNKQKSAEDLSQGSTRFSKLSGTVNLNQGVLTNTDLTVLAPDFQANGNGTINLINDNIDYHLNVTPSQGLQAHVGQLSMNIQHITIPMIITGTLQSPKLRPDYDALGTNPVKQTLQEKLDTVINKQHDHNVKKNLQKLQQFLGR